MKDFGHWRHWLPGANIFQCPLLYVGANAIYGWYPSMSRNCSFLYFGPNLKATYSVGFASTGRRLVIPYKKPLPTPSTIPGLLHSQLHPESDSPTQNKSNQPPASIQEDHKHTCIVSVIAHHSLTFGFSRIRFISPAKSAPTYLKVEKSVRSLSKNIESGSCLVRKSSFNGCTQGGG